ncbi:hypothetical protein [Nocardioides sp.]|uniref:hypothetical protein n=1 Tax=Nocardioides sp. TaxID=35761 RepID=UPI0035B0213E
MRRSGAASASPLAVAVVATKAVLLVMLALVLIDPAWGNLEGKAPVARALLYPSVALVVPVHRLLWPSTRPYPWLSDLLLTLSGFTDILGNRLDLYDRVWWFDDAVHLAVTMCVSAAVVLLTVERTASAAPVRDRAIAFGMTAGLAWEVFELVSFVTRSSEAPTAYGDTVGDLAMDWLGACLAVWLVHARWRHHLADRTREEETHGSGPAGGTGPGRVFRIGPGSTNFERISAATGETQCTRIVTTRQRRPGPTSGGSTSTSSCVRS